jgi:subtilase family serine protease
MLHPSVRGQFASEFITPMTPKKLLTIQFTVLFALLSISALQASAQNNFVPSRITQAVDESKLTVLSHNTYPLARAEFDRGPAPASLAMDNMLLVLKRGPEQEAALGKLMAEQLDKSSPNFHKWLTPQEFGQQFGPSDQDVQTITSWLGSHGFQVVEVSNGRTVINFSGNAGQVQQAFHTAIHSYVVKGEQHWANSSDPQIPTALAPVIAGVNTLHNFRWKPAYVHAGEFTKSKETGKVTPVNPKFTFPNTAICGNEDCFGVGPSDFATIYNVLPLWNGTGTPGGKKIDGTGVTVAVVAQTDINPSDYSDFRSMFGLPAATLTILPTTFPAGGCSSDPGTTVADEPEADIDTQWSGGIAKGATIDFVRCASTNTSNGVDLSATYIVNTLDVNKTIAVMTESYGACEAELGATGNQFYYQMWQQAATQGISVFIAAGDQGSAACDVGTANAPSTIAANGLQVSGFASTPFNVAIGGTDFDDLGTNGAVLSQFWNQTTTTNSTGVSALSYIPEVVWNNTCTSNLLVDFGFGTNALANCNNNAVGLFGAPLEAGSGGVSACTSGTPVDITDCIGGYPKPIWQAGSGISNDGKRDIPDISLFAGTGFFNGSFYIVCQMDANTGTGSSTSSCNLTTPFNDFQGFGGTSVGTPAMAGIMAMVVQETGELQGNPNPVHYNLASQANVFHPITGTNAMPCTPGSPDCTDASGSDTVGVLTVQTGPLAGSLGYNASSSFNLATGLGSVNAFNFVTNSAWTSALPPDFSICVPTCPQAASTASVTVAAGGSQGTTVTLEGTTGYTGTVTLSCSGLPVGTTCAFTPTTPVQVTGTTAVSVPVMLTNTVSGMLVPTSQQGAPTARAGAGKMMLLFLCLAILWLGIPASKRKLRWAVVSSLLLVGCLLGIAACGGGSSSSSSGGGGTPPVNPAVSNQTVVITATDGTGRTHSNYLLLTVQ